MKNLLIPFIFLLIALQATAQSNPQMDRPIQQCITEQKDKVQVLQGNFSIGSWLGKLIENCDKLQASSGKGGGPQVVTLLKMEKELDDLLAIADGCPTLKNEDVKTLLTEMKKIYAEKQKVETFKRDADDDGLFDDDKELTTMSLSRPSAGKIKSKAEKIKKLLKK